MPKRYAVVFPSQLSPGVSAICVSEEHHEEVGRLELDRAVRVWTVRAIISDHIPLAGNFDETLERPTHHSLILNENPLTIYIHKGGRNAVFFDLIGGADNRLSHIEVRVETDLPDRAIMLAAEPLNHLLDSVVRNYPLPLVISRLELLSPESGEVIAYCLLLPNSSGLSMGPLGGIWLDPLFVSVDAIWREALISSSPFYRLLCAYRLEDACDELRRVMRSIIKKRSLDLKLPPEPEAEKETLIAFGMTQEEVGRIRTVKDLFDHFRPMRNGIAHFLINAGVGSSDKVHAPISDGFMIRSYSVASSAALHHSHLKVEGLRRFFITNGLAESRGGSILPMPQRKMDFPVRDPTLQRPRATAAPAGRKT
jgi:hypothetical protein